MTDRHDWYLTGKAMRPFTAQQVTAARAFLGWNRRDLCEAAGVSLEAATGFEVATHETSLRDLAAIRRAFRNSGVDFQRGEFSGVIVTVPQKPWIDIR
jgi:hypothetical protein